MSRFYGSLCRYKCGVILISEEQTKWVLR